MIPFIGNVRTDKSTGRNRLVAAQGRENGGERASSGVMRMCQNQLMVVITVSTLNRVL